MLLMHISAIERDVLGVLGTTQAQPATVDLAHRLAGAPVDRLREASLHEAVGELRPQLERAQPTPYTRHTIDEPTNVSQA